MDTLDDFLPPRPATASRPLLGLTILLVEDSKFASDGIRLMCLRSGARIRRADSLANARRHLRVYRPGAVIVDMGLPDGSGAELIAEIAATTPRVPVILGTSGDPETEVRARDAGADGFLHKPVSRIADFQAALLAHLPPDRQPPGPRALPDDRIDPDPVSYRDDLTHAAEVLGKDTASQSLDYVAQFLGGVARSAGDAPLSEAAAALAARRRDGGQIGGEVARIAALVEARLTLAPPL